EASRDVPRPGDLGSEPGGEDEVRRDGGRPSGDSPARAGRGDSRRYVEWSRVRRGLAARRANPRRRDRDRLPGLGCELPWGAVLGGRIVTIEIPKAVLRTI